MGFCCNLLFFVLLGIRRKTATAATERADGEIINIAIFFNASDRYLKSIVQNAEDMFLVNQYENNLQNKSLKLYITLWRLDATDIEQSEVGLNESLTDLGNISSQIKGAIFVDINSDSLFLSSFLERSGIPTIGLFQSSGQRRTQVR